MNTANTGLPQDINGWEKFLNARNPNVMKLGLPRVRKAAGIMGLLNIPRDIPVVTVAGTNGKGSTAVMLASILEASGIKTGLYTSPHIVRFSERVVAGGKEASPADLCQAFAAVYGAEDPEDPMTFFEYTTLAALQIFKNQDCKALVLEVGLGGRLDATNIIDADIAIIPSIGLDHCHILGDTIAKIAGEKAGIIKSSTLVVITGALTPDADHVMREKAASYNVPLVASGKELDVVFTDKNTFSLNSPHMISDLKVPVLPLINAPLSVEAALILRDKKHLPVTDESIRKGLLSARLHGRFELISTNPRLIIDVAHNPPAACYLASCLKSDGFNERNAVIGMLKDKDICSTLKNVVSLFKKFFIVPLPGERGAPASSVREALEKAGVGKDMITEYPSVLPALTAALSATSAQGETVVFGSFLTVEQICCNIDCVRRIIAENKIDK